jgi:hypothetical protein
LQFLHSDSLFKVRTEDDLLYIPTLPTFDNSLSQRDVELLLSFLTVPYMRVPLLLNFFASDDRIHALRNDQLCQLLSASIFEPGRYLPNGKRVFAWK